MCYCYPDNRCDAHRAEAEAERLAALAAEADADEQAEADAEAEADDRALAEAQDDEQWWFDQAVENRIDSDRERAVFGD